MSRPGREPVSRKPKRTNKQHDVFHGLRKIMDYLLVYISATRQPAAKYFPQDLR
jgi:hypothetical protein